MSNTRLRRVVSTVRVYLVMCPLVGIRICHMSIRSQALDGSRVLPCACTLYVVYVALYVRWRSLFFDVSVLFNFEGGHSCFRVLLQLCMRFVLFLQFCRFVFMYVLRVRAHARACQCHGRPFALLAHNRATNEMQCQTTHVLGISLLFMIGPVPIRTQSHAK